MLRGKEIVLLMRIHQYVKNLFIFLPLFFALKVTDKDFLLDTIAAFVAFSFLASAVYILNDYHDIEEDRLHPRKKKRPLASGAISKPHAIFIMAFLFVTGFTIMIVLSPLAAGVLMFYFTMNVAYSFSLKHIAIVDIFVIALGFVLRLFVGSAVTGIHLSGWIVIMTFLLALFLALAKRRDDLLIYLNTGKKMRKVMDGYNMQFLDTAMAIMAAVVIVAYTNYTLSPDIVARANVNNEYLYLTSFFVILGIMRYLKLTFVLKSSGSPTRIFLRDAFMQITLLGWLVAFIFILYC